MAWPKRGTRKIVIEGEEFLWHYDAHCIWCGDDVFTVGKAGDPYVLYIDSYAFGEEIRPGNIAKSIRWALSNGWRTTKGSSKGMSFDVDRKEFYWFSDGVKHAGCQSVPPDNI